MDPLHLLVATSVVLAVGTIVALVLAIVHEHRIRTAQVGIMGTVERIDNALDVLRKLDHLGGDILDRKDVPKEIDSIIERVGKDFVSNIEKSKRQRLKCFVTFAHRPTDLRDSNIIHGVVKLLNADFLLAWIYDASEVENFEENMRARLSEEQRVKQGMLDQCLFIPMNDSFRQFPINFSVVAPFTRDKTILYLYFPDDDQRMFVLKVTNPSPYATRIDELALRMLAEGENPPNAWEPLVEMARRRVT